jgi:pimeloyl-ACP methyl ester carboxylesterase
MSIVPRRAFLSHSATAAAAVALSACGGSKAAESSVKPTFVFVHGAWHGAWCWSEVVSRLAKRGYPAIALDLPGHGIGARVPAAYAKQDLAGMATELSPLAALNLITFRDHVVSVLQGLQAGGMGPVILVGHSMGGMTVSAVAQAAPMLVRRLIYVTAYVPVRLSGMLAYMQQPEFASSQVSGLMVADPLAVGCARVNPRSADPVYRATAKSAFYGDLSDAAFEACAELLTPDEPASGDITVTREAWGAVPRAYVRCTADNAIPLAAQDSMIADADAFTASNKFMQYTLHSSHSPFVSQPDALVDILAGLA